MKRALNSIFAAVAVWPLLALAQSDAARHPPASEPRMGCGNFNYGRSALGPLDYRRTSEETIALVETRHFTGNVERLVKGEKGWLAGDIAYTLRVFPNHPRALRSAAELTRRNGGRMPQYMVYPIDCWFDRAIAYRPDDTQVRVVYATELVRARNFDEARRQVELAEKLAKGDPTVHYNVGLLYFELKDYERSMINARIAYESGFNLPGLKNKLTKAGQWKD